jgi:hypothetical protein
MNYDAMPDGNGVMKTVPTIGGWASYEHWFSKKWHTNIVAGYSNFKSDEINSFNIPDIGYAAANTTAEVQVQYFLVNFMWNPIPSVIIGAEWNIGKKREIYEGSINTGAATVNRLDESRIANRISFGTFFNF